LPKANSSLLATFKVDRQQLRTSADPVEATSRGDRVVRGEYHAFRSQWLPLPVTDENWRQLAPQQEAWWDLIHSSSDGGDIKRLWEPARFAWVYDLIRAHILTGDSLYADCFVRVFRGWLEANPPFRGLQWSCGQETAVRAVALLYAHANFELDSSTANQIRLVLSASGERIYDAIGYAESQRNNHALSESAALILLGQHFRDHHPEAEKWREYGQRTFVRVATDLFEQDGWYAQHSFTYLRVALEQAILAERGLRADGTSLPEPLRERIAAAIRLLLLLVNDNGDIPNHGSVDGALPHPVAMAEYRDFRPTLFSACALFDVPYPIDLTACPEVLCWNRTSAPLAGSARQDGVWHGPSGWAVVRLRGTMVFLRAGRYRSRPSHIDPLHVDVRVENESVVVDAGTYSYVLEQSWPFALDGEEVHNGPMVDGIRLAVRGPRFLWWKWPEATISEVNSGEDTVTLRAEIPGVVQRLVRVRANHVEVEDESLVVGAGMGIRWLLHPSASADQLTMSVPTTMHRGTDSVPWGWYAPHYGERLATLCIEGRFEARASTTARIVTRITGRNGLEP
jgi:hypothetical protein